MLAGWCVIGLAAIVGCLIGVQTFNPAPLWAYVSWLALTAAGFLVLMMWMFFRGATCDVTRNDLQAQRIGAGFSCGWVSALWFFSCFCFSTIAAYCAYMVWHWMVFLYHYQESQPLLQFEDRSVKAH